MKKQYSKTQNTCKVTFSLPAEAVSGASSVTLLGDFNEWQEQAGIPLKPQKDGSYKTQLELSGGKSYEFRYLVDGYRWENDYNADQYVPSPYNGVDNCVVEVTAKKAAAAPKAKAKPTSKKKAAKKDDLRKVEGVGPKIAKILGEEGIKSFKDLSTTARSQVERSSSTSRPKIQNAFASYLATASAIG